MKSWMTIRRRQSPKTPTSTIVHRRMTHTAIPTPRKRAKAIVRAMKMISWRKTRRSLQRVNWITSC